MEGRCAPPDVGRSCDSFFWNLDTFPTDGAPARPPGRPRRPLSGSRSSLLPSPWKCPLEGIPRPRGRRAALAASANKEINKVLCGVACARPRRRLLLLAGGKWGSLAAATWPLLRPPRQRVPGDLGSTPSTSPLLLPRQGNDQRAGLLMDGNKIRREIRGCPVSMGPRGRQPLGRQQ